MGSIKSLENNVAKERALFQIQIQKLKAENTALSFKVQQLTESAGRKSRAGSPALKHNYSSSVRTTYSNRRRSRSRSSSISSHVKTSRSSLSAGILLSPNQYNKIHAYCTFLTSFLLHQHNYRQLTGVD